MAAVGTNPAVTCQIRHAPNIAPTHPLCIPRYVPAYGPGSGTGATAG
jgi:hypothetical protein